SDSRVPLHHPTRFPYTTLFRSDCAVGPAGLLRVAQIQCGAGFSLQRALARPRRIEQMANLLARKPLSLLLEECTQSGEHSLKRRSEEHTSELQSRGHLVCRLLL